jgi:hypothetical protein
VSTDRRCWRGEVCSCYESSIWTGYEEIKVTINPVRTSSTFSTPVFVWSLFPLGRR